MRLQSSHECRRCRRWLEGEMADAGAQTRADLMEQIRAGECWPCQAARIYAAGRYILASDAVRLHGLLFGPGSVPQALRDAVADASEALTLAGLGGRSWPVRPDSPAQKLFRRQREERRRNR